MSEPLAWEKRGTHQGTIWGHRCRIEQFFFNPHLPSCIRHQVLDPDERQEIEGKSFNSFRPKSAELAQNLEETFQRQTSGGSR